MPQDTKVHGGAWHHSCSARARPLTQANEREEAALQLQIFASVAIQDPLLHQPRFNGFVAQICERDDNLAYDI